MAEVDQKELTLLASVAYGESSYRQNSFEEMAGLAAVMLRQMKCRGYEKMSDFTRMEKSFSYVVSDGKPRFQSLKDTNERDVHASYVAADAKLKTLVEQIELREKEPGIVSGRDKKGIAELKLLKSRRKGFDFQRNEAEGKDMAYRAARHAMEGGQDYSNGAYFWDGWDIKTHYSTHPKVKVGVHFADPSHNIFGIKESSVVIVKFKQVKETKGAKVSITKVEVGRYDHVYISTAAYGGTVFWKFNPDYVRLERTKEYL